MEDTRRHQGLAQPTSDNNMPIHAPKVAQTPNVLAEPMFI